MAAWEISRVTFEGVAPAHAGTGQTAWEFTAGAGGRSYSVYLVVQNKVLVRHAGLHPGEPPPAELLPRLLACVRQRLEHPMTADRYPRSLQEVKVTVNTKPEWLELMDQD